MVPLIVGAVIIWSVTRSGANAACYKQPTILLCLWFEGGSLGSARAVITVPSVVWYFVSQFSKVRDRIEGGYSRFSVTSPNACSLNLKP